MAYQALVVDHSGRSGSYSRTFFDELELDNFITELMIEAGWSPEEIDDVLASTCSEAGVEVDNATTLHIVRD